MDILAIVGGLAVLHILIFALLKMLFERLEGRL